MSGKDKQERGAVAAQVRQPASYFPAQMHTPVQVESPGARKHACWYATGRTPYLGSASVANRGTGMLKEHPGQESMIVTMTGFALGLHTLCNDPGSEASRWKQ